MASALFGAQTLVSAANHSRGGLAKIDLPSPNTTMTEHGRLGCALDNAAGEKGIDNERYEIRMPDGRSGAGSRRRRRRPG